MDTTEELNGTYFYHGMDNVTAQDLFWIIFIEEFAKHEGLTIESAAMILLGWPLIPKYKGLGKSTWGTSVASIASRKIFRDMRFAGQVETPVGFMKTRMTNKIGAAVGRYAPYVGYVNAIIVFSIIAKGTRKQYNLIARPEHRIEWTVF